MSELTRFITRPIKVTAIRLETPSEATTIAQWLGCTVNRVYRNATQVTKFEHATFHVDGRDFTVALGEWLVRGPNGLYVLEHDSFTARFEKS
ncbi:hypothetical protein [Rhodococcus sp. NPDC003348]